MMPVRERYDEIVMLKARVEKGVAENTSQKNAPSESDPTITGSKYCVQYRPSTEKRAV